MNKLEEKKLANHFFEILDQIDINEKIVVELFNKQYLAKRFDLVSNVDILIQGTIITSLTGTNGSIFNLLYINKPGIVSLLMGEDEKLVGQLFDIRIDSTKAIFYKLIELNFGNWLINDSLLHKYVNNYYGRTINENNHRLMQYVSQNKSGQVYSFLYHCTQLLGVENK